MYVYIYIYIYVCVEREREREIHISLCIYIYIYIYICVASFGHEYATRDLSRWRICNAPHACMQATLAEDTPADEDVSIVEAAEEVVTYVHATYTC